MYFEVPFYMFLIVIASFLYSWQAVYKNFEHQCNEPDHPISTEPSALDGDRAAPFGASIVTLDRNSIIENRDEPLLEH